MSRSITNITNNQTAHFEELFNEHKKQLPGNNLPWLQEKREKAIKSFSEKGFPTAKDEDWRYTPMAVLNSVSWQMCQQTAKPPHHSFLENFHHEWMDQYCKESLNEYIIVDMHTACEKYSHYLEKYMGKLSNTHFDSLNTALFTQGFFILIKKNVHIEKPIWITYPNLSSEHLACFRNLVILEEGAQATIIESFANTSENDFNTSFINTVTEAYIDKKARLTHYRQQDDTKENKHIHLSQLYIKQQAHSRTENYVISTGGSWIRSDTHIRLEEEYAHCVLNGITLGSKKQYIDHHTSVEHLTPHGTSDEYYKSILSDDAKGVFNGKVIVSPEAIQTDASQSNKTLLLSRAAQMNTKPQLEIFSDDVKCTHGATIGQLDEDALFYLQARGISYPDAQKLLIEAFLSDLLERISLPSIKEKVQQKIAGYLSRGE